jgi:hypothetical protein
MRLMRVPDPATIRAWARATGRSVGSRGAISTQLQHEYARALVTSRLRSAGLAAGRVALAVAPQGARAAADRRTRRLQ